MKIDQDATGLGLFVVTMIAAALLVPELSVGLLGQPAFWAVIGGAVTLTVITILRSQGRRGTAVERVVLATFLFLMPTVYLASWLRSGGEITWFWIELSGQVGFGALAVLGLRRSPWLLAAGIGAHGLLWDAWHYGRTPFMPDWYAIACAVVDVGAGVYVATQVSAWRGSQRADRDPTLARR